MYLTKNRSRTDQHSDDVDNLEFRRGKHTSRVSENSNGTLQAAASAISSVIRSGDKSKHSGFNIDELPDGSCISPHRMIINSFHEDDGQKTSVKSANYIGSFPVSGDSQEKRTQHINSKLHQLRSSRKSREILLVMSITGIKVCNSNGQSVLMAHALKRISSASCDPFFCTFNFLSREPKDETATQYCHAFLTSSSEAAEELNAIIGNTFRTAFEIQQPTSQKAPTFHEMIERQLSDQKIKAEEQKIEEKRQLQEQLTQISNIGTVRQMARERREKKHRDSQLVDLENEMLRVSRRDRPGWAKNIASKAIHRLPLLDNDRKSPSLSPVHVSNTHSTLTHFSVSDIKEAIDKKVVHGSPITAMKETIDNHFQQQQQHQQKQNYSTRVSAPHSESVPAMLNNFKPNSPLHSTNITNRPLPATPDELSDDFYSKRNSSPLIPPPSSSSLAEIKRFSHQEIINNNSPRKHATPNTQDDSVDAVAENLKSLSSGDEASLSSEDSLDGRVEEIQNSFHNIHKDIENSSWYQPHLPREEVLESLRSKRIGSFIVRDSTSRPGCYALSVKVPVEDNPEGVSHYLVMPTNGGGVKLSGLDKEWPSMSALVTHHRIMMDQLPCTLASVDSTAVDVRSPSPSTNPTFISDESHDSDSDSDNDEDYRRLTNYASLLDAPSC